MAERHRPMAVMLGSMLRLEYKAQDVRSVTKPYIPPTASVKVPCPLNAWHPSRC
jgi:hypothetical protein